MAGDTVLTMEPICHCPVCREDGHPPTPDEVIVGLTTAMLRSDWSMVATIAQTLQDRYGGMTDAEVMVAANAEVVRLALTAVAATTTPIEA